MKRPNLLQLVISMTAVAMGACTMLSGQDAGSTGVSVLTWQYDHARTGQNLNEGTLVYNTLSKSNFGQRCSVQLDGQVYAQPLVVTNSKINGTLYSYVAYVVTENDTLYAINGTPPAGTGNTCGPVASLPFLTTGATNGHSPADCGQIGGKDCKTIAPKVGILGTPVIVLANHTATMYLVTETQTGTSPPLTFYHYLHSVDLPTLTENTSVQIYPPGQQSGSSLFSQNHIQRPGLLYADGYVYVAFSMMDGAGKPYPTGAIFAYNPTTLAEAGYLQTSAGQNNADGAGIWQGGAGLAYGPDSATGSNYIFFNTANGVFDVDTGGTNYGDSFVKLNPTPDASGNLTVAATFTPADQYFRSTATCTGGNSPGDYDFGSGGVMLIPPHELRTPYLAVSGDKEGGIWFMNLASPGGFAGTDTCSSSGGDQNVQTWPVNGSVSFSGPVIHTNPAFWETTAGTNYLFIGPQRMGTWSGDLLQYTLCPTGKPINSTCGTNYVVATDQNGVGVVFPNGVTPSISQSATDSSDAILWAIRADGSVQGSSVVGRLYAFKAVEMTQLYSSTLCTGDALQYPATKFSVPTVANGFVYVGGQGPFNTVQNDWNNGMFYIFGGLTRSC